VVTRAYDLRAPRRPAGGTGAVPWLLAGATVAAQVAYPLLAGEALRRVTLAVVVLFFLASVAHALVHRGPVFAAVLVAVAGGGGLLAEAVGVRTGLPFGRYAYAESLGPAVLDVPVVVPLAWTMMAYPALLAGRRLARRGAFLVAGFALAAWDVFLDPQMVADGRWRWADPTPSLPGLDEVPLTNHLGWLVVATVLMLLLDLLLPRDAASEAQPATLFLWTYVGSVVGNAAFFDRPGVALAGGVAMGLVAVPYAWALWQSRP
jgi:putative membrane protein